VEGSGGQVQLGSELWTAENVDATEPIGKGEKVEVVEVKGLRLKVRKIK
jgi:membrane protein implicated in regulation of membrane protease activity